MTPATVSPAPVLAMIAAFESGPISGFGDAGLQALALAIYNQGLSDGAAVPVAATVPAAQVVTDLQALQAGDDAAFAAAIAKYSPTPVVPASS